MTEQVIDSSIAGFSGVKQDSSLSEDLIVYRADIQVGFNKDIFLVKVLNSDPLRIHLRCDKLLAKTLKQRYETVSSSDVMNPDEWIQVICSGQLTNDEVIDLVRHSYYMIVGVSN